MAPRDVNLSEICTPGCCSFSSLARREIDFCSYSVWLCVDSSHYRISSASPAVDHAGWCKWCTVYSPLRKTLCRYIFVEKKNESMIQSYGQSCWSGFEFFDLVAIMFEKLKRYINSFSKMLNHSLIANLIQCIYHFLNHSYQERSLLIFAKIN